MPDPVITPAFGALISDYQIEQAVLALLDPYLDGYLTEVETQHGIAPETLARPRSQQSSYDFENWAEGQLPALIVVCQGTVGTPIRTASFYSAWFDVRAGVMVEDTSEANARMVTQLHQAALDGILDQHPDLGNGFASDLEFVGRATRLPDVPNRTLAYAESTYHILVEALVRHAGLTQPGPPPPVQDAEDLNLDFDAEPVDQPLPDEPVTPPDYEPVLPPE